MINDPELYFRLAEFPLIEREASKVTCFLRYFCKICDHEDMLLMAASAAFFTHLPKTWFFQSTYRERRRLAMRLISLRKGLTLSPQVNQEAGQVILLGLIYALLNDWDITLPREDTPLDLFIIWCGPRHAHGLVALREWLALQESKIKDYQDRKAL